ncbi:hypothetical protein GALMADRAFT_1124665 [Galerina marginata CBS 339.88]|uniref:Nephrocystin 3-like N-terminal domain-containing protein n=1 Tax=Galerina marginata (strain CBS 339.88) TaxID=685588 RepID=A0A067TDF0_GALM3|nr:hypothetical protein GALMADRAFT_1124665 [Galerina marginata CBS 339.88]
MTDGESQTSKASSTRFLQLPKKWVKATFSRNHSRASSPAPSASEQENSGGDLSPVQHAIVSSGQLSVDPATGSSTPSQQDHSRAFSISSGLSGPAVTHDQHNNSTQDGATSISSTQSGRPVGDLSETLVNPTDRARLTVIDIAGLALSFTAMLLKRLPEVVDTNPAKIVLGVVKIILEIKEAVQGNTDAVDRRIISTADQLRAVEGALTGWKPNDEEETRGVRLFRTTISNELVNLFELQKQSLARRIADHEGDQGQIAEIFERINQARERLVVVTGLRVQKAVIAIQEDLRRLLLKELQASHIADHKFKLGGQQKQLLRRAVCTPGTRVDILSKITKWANDDSTESQSVFWLFGQAGSGKSTIAYTIARRFEFASDADDTIILGGNFFCSRQFEETKDATCIIRTIVYHLARRYEAFAEALRTSGDFDTIYQDSSIQLESLLIEPWKLAQSANPSKSARFLVVIDALDEIDGQGGSEFLRNLLDSVSKHRLRGLKFFATSRPDQKLVDHVEAFDDKESYRLEQVPIEEAQADITTYLNAYLGDSVGRLELEKIAVQAAGLFIYAATVVKYVEGYAPVEHEERLSTLFVSDSDNPEETLLDGLYYQVLLDARRRFKSGHYLNILHTFICTVERTSPSLVAELLLLPNSPNAARSHNEIADGVLKSLHAVLYIENGKVFSYHKSFTDFMFDRKRAKDEFWCDRAKHHRLLTNSCFRAMNKLKFNIANIKSSFLLDRDNSGLRDAVKQNIPPVLSYSCRNWDYHLSAVSTIDSDALRNTLSNFLELRVLFWIEAMNLLGFRGLCDRMLQRARRWVPDDDLVLKEDFAETASFALYFSGSGAALSTPHLYISALTTWSRNLRPCREWRRHFSGIPVFANALQNDKPLMTLGVGSPVYAVAFSSDDRLIVSASDDKLVRVWDVSKGEMLKVLDGHTDSVNSVAFSSDNKLIVSGSADKSVRVWDAWTGETLKVLEGHTAPIFSVTFSSDDRRIVSGSEDKSARVWDALTGEMLKVLEGHTDAVGSVAFSNDDKYIISGSDDKLVRVWDASTGNTLKILEGHTEPVLSVAFSGDGRRIISGSDDTSVRVWDASTGELLKVLEGHTESVLSVAFSSDDKKIVSGSDERSVRVWDSLTGETLKVLEGHIEAVSSAKFSSDNRRIVSCSDDESVRVWDATTGEMQKALDGHTEPVFSVAFSSDNKQIISGSDDKSVRVWDASSGNLLKVLEGHTESIWSAVFSSDDKRIVSGSDDNSVRVWDASTGAVLKVLEGHTGSVSSVTFSSDDKQIISCSDDKTVRVWDSLTGETLKILEGHTEPIFSIAISIDDEYIVSGSDDKSVRIWDTSTGKVLRVLEGHTEPVLSVAFSSTANQIVSSSDDKSVRVWDAATGEMLKVMEGHTQAVLSVSFSNDDRQIVSCSDDKSVRVWDALSGKLLKMLEGHTESVWSVAFSSDDKWIVSASDDESVRVWDPSLAVMLTMPEGDAVEHASISSEDQQIVSGSEDESARVQASHTQQPSLRYIRQKIADSSGHKRHTGWLLSPQEGHYLMFVPPAENLPDPSNILTLPRSYAPSVDISSATLGLEWRNCFSPKD